MKVSYFQFDISWENPKENWRIISENLPLDSDVFVLPEMFLTGFSMAPKKLAIQMDDPIISEIAEISTRENMAICGSLMVEENGNYYNRCFWFDPNGSISFYDKKHLFSMAGGHEVFAAGSSQTIVSYKDWRIALQVCYDLRFPVWARNVDSYDILIYVANWPDARVKHWNALLRARAIENQCYVIGVNRMGDDGTGKPHSGYSQIVDPVGEIQVISEGKQELASAVLSKDRLREIRDKLPFLQDRDDFKII